MAFRIQVIRVVLHERGAALEVGADDLHGAEERGGFPIALGAEAVAIGHQALHREPGQLTQTVEVFKRRREALESAVGEKRPQPELNAGAVAQRLVTRSPAAERFGDGVARLVFGCRAS
jgi:hypothetical protein